MKINDDDDDGDGDYTRTPTKNTARADRMPCALPTSLLFSFFSLGSLSRFTSGLSFPFFAS
jgi:hypothetical protein